MTGPLGGMALFSAILSIPLFLSARKWIAGAKYNDKGKAKFGRVHFYLTILELYASACYFGFPMSLFVLQSVFGEMVGLGFDDEAVPWLVAFMIVALITTIVIRQTLRDEDVISEFGWDETKIDNHTSIFRLIIIMIAPILIILVLVAIGLSLSSSSNTCSRCGSTLGPSGWCSRCGKYRY